MPRWKEQVRRRRKRYTRRLPESAKRAKRLAALAKLSFIAVAAFFLISLIVIPILAFNLPSPDKIVRREGFSTKILDRNGEVLYDIFAEQKRTPVSLNDVPLYLRQATIAIEDKNFYKHQGFDPTGMFRAAFNIVFRGKLQGGSTLTQQLVKNVLLTPERTIFRKVREFILAIQIERRYTKDEILQMYLNEAPYGGTAWGVEVATETYFGKKVKDLDLIESAILAGMPQRPSSYSPYSSNPKAYIGRTQEVLRRMREDDYITREQEDAARAELENVVFQERGASFKAPHFVQYVQRILEERYSERVVEQGGLRVTTTLDLELQEKAQDIVREEIERVKGVRISNGAAVVLDPETGEILAMVGSRGFNDPEIDGQVNVTMSLRQPGSAIKPVTYVTAFKKGFTPSTLIMDVPTTFPGGIGQPDYKPENYDGKFRGPMQVRFTLGNSINLAAVKMLAMVGIKSTLQTAYDLGISTLPPTQETLNRVGLSLTLGGGEVRLLELTGAYGAFMNEGYKVEPIAILKVEDSDGKVLEETKPKKGKRVLSAEQAFLIADILSDNNARLEIFGPRSHLYIAGKDIAVKTGTTNDRRDNWTIGGNSQAVIGVWVGNNDNSPMLQVASGVTGASPIWRRIIIEALKGKPAANFNPPSGIVSAAVDTVSGYRAHDGFPSRIEYFIKGTEPGEDPIHVRLKVCKTDGGLATPSDIASGNYEEKEFFVFKEEDPTAGLGGQNRWQEGILAWLEGQSDSRYHPPNDYCGTSNPVNVEFINPHDHDENLSKNFTIKVSADSTSRIVQVKLEIDGNEEKVFDKPPFELPIILSDGVYVLRAIAKDENGRESDRKITIGVGVRWDPSPSPSPSPSP
ncbi:PBP1A family penicillin-binding protein [Candidatus Woesebacteria bacterium]|nr:PBP1A family penicillin-binding protein [Candidatus Woesebacteria bacterium]